MFVSMIVFSDIYHMIYFSDVISLGCSGKECLPCRRLQFNSWVGKITLEEGMATHSSIFAWRIFRDTGAWQATVHGVAKNQTRLRDQAQHTVSLIFLLCLISNS